MPPTKRLPRAYINCEKEDLITLISRMVNSLIEVNDRYINSGVDSSLSSENLTRFHSRAPPSISVYDYLIRLAKYSSLENAVLIIAVYYIDLLLNTYKNFNLNSLTVHRFFLTATTVASKGLCDSFCTNLHYSKVGGIKVHELNFLEMEFLQRVSWRIIPRPNLTDGESYLTKPGNAKKRKREEESPVQARNRFSVSSASSSSSSSSAASDKQAESSLAIRLSDIGGYSELLDDYYRKMVELVGREGKIYYVLE